MRGNEVLPERRRGDGGVAGTAGAGSESTGKVGGSRSTCALEAGATGDEKGSTCCGTSTSASPAAGISWFGKGALRPIGLNRMEGPWEGPSAGSGSRARDRGAPGGGPASTDLNQMSACHPRERRTVEVRLSSGGVRKHPAPPARLAGDPSERKDYLPLRCSFLPRVASPVDAGRGAPRLLAQRAGPTPGGMATRWRRSCGLPTVTGARRRAKRPYRPAMTPQPIRPPALPTG